MSTPDPTVRGQELIVHSIRKSLDWKGWKGVIDMISGAGVRGYTGSGHETLKTL